jgi:hypothetical protein
MQRRQHPGAVNLVNEIERRRVGEVEPLGRHFDRDFGPGETYYRQAKARKFTWDTCCLEMDRATQ